MPGLQYLIIVLTGALLTGCVPGTHRDAFSQRAFEPADSLVMTEPLRIPAGKAHALFQDGTPVSGVDRSRLYCEFEIETVAEQPREVAADRFAIRYVSRRIVSDELAGIPPFVPSGGSCWDDVYYETRWWLRSQRQPGVRVLICRERFPRCQAGWYPAPETVLLTLGPAFALDLPASGPITPGSPDTNRWHAGAAP
jgi:hypothetical protein